MPHTRGDEIHKLYENMAYNEVSTINVNQAITDLVKRHNICQDQSITLNATGELARRLYEIADMVEKDRSALNNIFSKRVPVGSEEPAKDIDILISLSRYYATLIVRGQLWRQVNIDGGTWPENAVSSVYYTLSTIIQSSHIQVYLKHISFGPRVVLGGQSSIDTAMIVMADADVDAAVVTLTSDRVGKTDYLDRPLWYLKKIWVQEPVKNKFLRLIDGLRVKEDTSSIKSMLRGFRNKDEVLQNLDKEIHVKAVSIWTENVVTAKNMANAADRVFLVWINCYGETGPGVSLPWSDVEHHNVNPVPHVASSALQKRADGRKIVDLFYDGMWKEPVEEEYREDDDGTLRASATQSDIEKCVASAAKAFKKWRSLALSQRQKCFFRLANRIQSTGDSELARSIRTWAESPSLCNSSALRIRDGSVEIVTTREPKGTIVIASEIREALFHRITCACVTGNVVIIVNVVPSSKTSGIENYFDMFATCGFPPGIINLLSFDDVEAAVMNITKIRSVAVICTDHSSKLLTRQKYWIDTEVDEDLLDEKLCAKYTRPKSVWLPLK